MYIIVQTVVLQKLLQLGCIGWIGKSSIIFASVENEVEPQG